MAHLRIAALVMAALSLLGCGQVRAATDTPVPAEVVEFDPQEYGRPGYAALTTEPVRLSVFAGWYGRAEPGGDRVVPDPGRTLLAVAGDTGCRLATGVALHRVGDDLRVDFTGGTASQTCTRPFGPVALLSVPTAAVAGVRTVDGRPPVAATGPGVLTGFVRLPAGPQAAVELGPAAAALAAQVRDDAQARALLDRPVPAGARAFAFVLSGCRDTSAELLVRPGGMAAEPVGGDGVACFLPEYYLATFEVPADRVPEPALLDR
ncbi:hypothetical protein ACQEVB_01285 [Pseudonocardia sp. CA-107938]|uniref:hypothetical protein n=1 Tax=Pseudonocardia sp. CA-107938 TaxID=3240021 RepID=UPI003D8C1F03